MKQRLNYRAYSRHLVSYGMLINSLFVFVPFSIGIIIMIFLHPDEFLSFGDIIIWLVPPLLVSAYLAVFVAISGIISSFLVYLSAIYFFDAPHQNNPKFQKMAVACVFITNILVVSYLSMWITGGLGNQRWMFFATFPSGIVMIVIHRFSFPRLFITSSKRKEKVES